MKKKWCFTFRVEPTALEGTVSGRFGASLLFVAYSKWLRQWFWIYPGGMQRIEEPEMLLLDPEWAREHPRTKTPVVRRENPFKLRKQKAEQLVLL